MGNLAEGQKVDPLIGHLLSLWGEKTAEEDLMKCDLGYWREWRIFHALVYNFLPQPGLRDRLLPDGTSLV